MTSSSRGGTKEDWSTVRPDNTVAMPPPAATAALIISVDIVFSETAEVKDEMASVTKAPLASSVST